MTERSTLSNRVADVYMSQSSGRADRYDPGKHVFHPCDQDENNAYISPLPELLCGPTSTNEVKRSMAVPLTLHQIMASVIDYGHLSELWFSLSVRKRSTRIDLIRTRTFDAFYMLTQKWKIIIYAPMLRTVPIAYYAHPHHPHHHHHHHYYF